MTFDELQAIKKIAYDAPETRAMIYVPPEDQAINLNWTNPWDNTDERVASLWWPGHPPEETENAERIYEALATLWANARPLILKLTHEVEKLRDKVRDLESDKAYAADTVAAALERLEK